MGQNLSLSSLQKDEVLHEALCSRLTSAQGVQQCTICKRLEHSLERQKMGVESSWAEGGVTLLPHSTDEFASHLCCCMPAVFILLTCFSVSWGPWKDVGVAWHGKRASSSFLADTGSSKLW